MPMPPMDMAPWRDPAEGAFSTVVPRGWRAEGGLRRMASVDARPELLVQSPDGHILVRLGDAFIGSMVMPNQMLAASGFREGGFYSPGYGVRLRVLRYLPGAAFLTNFYLPQRVSQFSNVQARDLPQVTQQAMATYSRYGMNIRVDTGETQFMAQSPNGPMHGYAFAMTRLVMAPGGGSAVWEVPYFFGYLAAPNQEAQARAVLDSMVANLRNGPQLDEPPGPTGRADQRHRKQRHQ